MQLGIYKTQQIVYCDGFSETAGLYKRDTCMAMFNGV